MKKIILVLFLLIPFVIFAQQKEKQKQLYRKPFTFTIGLNTQIFRQDFRYTTTESVVGNTVTTVYYNKIEGFKKPLYGITIRVSKSIINNRLNAGFQTGLSKLKLLTATIRNDKEYLYIIPITTFLKIDMWKNKKINSFFKIKGGYTYFEYFGRNYSLQGGLNYGFETGFSIYSKHKKWLNHLEFAIGYNYFFTKFSYEYDFPRELKYSYNQRREGLTFGINYNFTQKKKRKKHKKKH